MKKFSWFNISIICLIFTIVSFGIVVGIGGLIKNININIGLLIIPILISITGNITACISLIKSKDKKMKAILLLTVNLIATILILFILSIIIALKNLT